VSASGNSITTIRSGCGSPSKQIDLAATHDKAAAKARYAGGGKRPIFIVSRGIGDLDFSNDVSGHGMLLTLQTSSDGSSPCGNGGNSYMLRIHSQIRLSNDG
jgi:hypothetical protein